MAAPTLALLPDELLKESPSRKDGVAPDVEHRHRVFGCELIQEAGILLDLSQVVMASAQNLFHRFFYRQSLTQRDAFAVAQACLFLAAKVDEESRSQVDVLNVFHRLWQQRRGVHPMPLDTDSDLYGSWLARLEDHEATLLREIGFSTYNIIDHPHKFILYYVKVLNGDKALSQAAWNFLNDSLRLDLTVRYSSGVIASAAVYLAARKLRVALPPRWHRVFGARRKELRTICRRILELYSAEKVVWLGSLRSDASAEEKQSKAVDGPVEAAATSESNGASATAAAPAAANATAAANGTATQSEATTNASADASGSQPAATSGSSAVDGDGSGAGAGAGAATSAAPVSDRAQARDRSDADGHSHSQGRRRRSHSRDRRGRRRRSSSSSRGRRRDRDRGRDRDRDRRRPRRSRSRSHSGDSRRRKRRSRSRSPLQRRHSRDRRR